MPKLARFAATAAAVTALSAPAALAAPVSVNLRVEGAGKTYFEGDGVAVTGWPVGTLVRGNVVMWEGELAAPSLGEAVRFEEALA